MHKLQEQCPKDSRQRALIASGLLTERRLRIAEVVRAVAAEVERPPSQVALAWTMLTPAVVSPIIGASKVQHLMDNLGALDITLTAAQSARLDQATAVELGFPHDFVQRMVRKKNLMISLSVIGAERLF